MRKLYLFDMVTLDGYFEGPNREIDWHTVDAEFNEFAIRQLHETDALIFGRVTYELMAGYWQTPAALKDDPVVAGLMNSIEKIVFSTTLGKADWNNTRLVKDNIRKEITKLKEADGREIGIFGSTNLASSLFAMGVVDELRIMVSPVILGKGRPFFAGDSMQLELLRTRAFKSGNLLLYYRPLVK